MARRARTGNIAIENDLYTFRVSESTPDVASIADLAAEILAATTKDTFIETDKAEIEAAGLRALAALEAMRPGVYRVGEDDRVGIVAYVALLATQHPSMMHRRAAAAADRFWSVAAATFHHDPEVRRLFKGMDHDFSVLGLIPDQLLLALELNYLSWNVIRWHGTARLVLGDSAVVASYPGTPFGAGDAWTAGAQFFVPISPTCALILGGFDPGLCLVEDRSGERAESDVRTVNRLSWVRAAREVYAVDPGDLLQVVPELGPLGPHFAMPDQLGVREDVLPTFWIDSYGGLHIDEPPSVMDDDTAARFRERQVGSQT